MNDSISRQAAIAHLKQRLYETQLNNDTEHPYYEEIADNRIETWINELPSVQPEQKWISVGERLPLYGQDVLAVRTYGDGEKCQEVLMAHIAVWNEETGKKWWNATNITHWMPLPDPPKEE